MRYFGTILRKKNYLLLHLVVKENVQGERDLDKKQFVYLKNIQRYFKKVAFF